MRPRIRNPSERLSIAQACVRVRHQPATPSSATGEPARGRDDQGRRYVQEEAVDACPSQRRSPRHEVAKAERDNTTPPAALVVEREVDVGGSSPAQRRRRGEATRHRRAASGEQHPNRGHRPWKGRGQTASGEQHPNRGQRPWKGRNAGLPE